MPTHSMRLLLASACTALLLAGCNPPSSNDAGKVTPSGKDTVAVVNGTPISREEFNQYAAHRMQPGSTPSPDEAKAILNEMVSLELVVQDAVKKGVDKQPEAQRMIENQRRMVIANVAMREYVKSHPISDEDVKKEYDARIGGAGTKELKARHILVKTEAEAKDIIAQLDKGGDFAKLAKAKSSDSSAKEGGDLGWFNPNQMVKPFADAALALKKGEYTKAPVKSQFGWHVILLEDTRAANAPPFEQMKERVRAFMQQQLSQKYLQELKTQGKVEMKEQNLPVAAPALKEGKPAAEAKPATPANSGN